MGNSWGDRIILGAVMRTIMSIALLVCLSVMLFAGPGEASLSGSCKSGGTYPNCDGGEILFAGSNYSGQVHVIVTNSSGQVIDDGYYTTADGILKFVENLSFADTYSISVNDLTILSVTTQGR